MNKDTITDSLEKLLMAIHRQVVAIRDTDEQVPKIEMDKTLANIRALYEQFTVLNYLNAYPPAKRTENSAVEEKTMVVEKAVEPKIEKPVEPKKEIEHPFVPINEMKYAPASAPESQPITEKEEKTIEEPVQKNVQPQKEEPAVSKPVAEEPVKYVHQTAAAASGEPQRLGDRLRSQRLADLYTAVTLSDKFLYMNELFEGENSAYREAMDMLNRLTVKEEAEQYLNSLAARYKWDEHERVEKKFRELVSRKFV